MSKKEFGGEVEITGGEFRRRKIVTPGGGTHPMGSRERLALFNSIGSSLVGADVLDAYAGSGAIGFEALSRGAKSATFIDKAPGARQAIKHNIVELGVEDRCTLIPMRVEEYAQINRPSEESQPGFDFIFADPPYDDFDPRGIDGLSYCLKPEGLLALSHPDVTPDFPRLVKLRTRKYAGAHLTFYQKKSLPDTLN